MVVLLRSFTDIVFLAEMHLHPQLQAHVARHVRNNEFQTIVSTHSPYFVDLGAWRGTTRCAFDGTAPRREVLDRVLAGKTMRDQLDDIAKWKYHETLFALGDADVIFARYVLLTEGPAEKYGLPRIAKVMGVAWDQVTVISCNGKTKIAHYALLCRAYEIPTFVVFDLDEGKKGADAATALVLKYVDEFPRFMFKKSFEAAFNIGSSAEHKASEVLLAIDACSSPSDVPSEVQNAIEELAKWRKQLSTSQRQQTAAPADSNSPKRETDE